MSDTTRPPPIPPELVAWLEKRYPNACADPLDSKREIWMKVGEQRMIRRLRVLSNQQTQEALEG